jgi:hypothetical protein
VHVEGCQLDAAQAVSGLDVLDQLSPLAERSLVAVTHDETGPRYLRAASAGMLRDGHADPALRLANALTGYWFLRGRRAESSRALKAALELGGSPALRAQAAVWQLGLDIVAGGSTDRVDAVLAGVHTPCHGRGAVTVVSGICFVHRGRGNPRSLSRWPGWSRPRAITGGPPSCTNRAVSWPKTSGCGAM